MVIRLGELTRLRLGELMDLAGEYELRDGARAAADPEERRTRDWASVGAAAAISSTVIQA